MPKLPKKAAPALTVPQLRALVLLAESPQTLARLSKLGGAISLPEMQGLAAAGYCKGQTIDLDGIKENLWQITIAGIGYLETHAAPPIEKIRTDKITALCPWFGSARGQAKQIGAAFAGIKWAGVLFGGSLCEIPAMLAAKVNSISVNDKHENLINLARVMADEMLGPKLYRQLRREPFTESTLDCAQAYFRNGGIDLSEPHLCAAINYFICAWAGRNGKAGTTGELKGGLSVRWGATGGDSAARFSGAVWSIRDWRRVLARCTLFCMDWRDFIVKCKDVRENGIYADPPWPGLGVGYVHTFTDTEHWELSQSLNGFDKARVILRTGDSKLMRDLYPADLGWVWRAMLGRNQAGKETAEYLVIKNGA